MSAGANQVPDFAEAIPLVLRTARARSASALAANGDGAFERDDLVQEALVAVWRALRRYDSRRSSLRTFIERIVESKIRSLLRRQRTAKRTKRYQSPEPSALEFMVHVEIQIDVHRALRGLAPVDARVARLLLHEYRPAEIGRVLKISRTAVYRCIGRIRAAISKDGFV
jgi:RNA polymerase sigma factor (sigma-70 family)